MFHKARILFVRVSQQGPCFITIEEQVTRDLYNLSLLAKLMVLHC